MHLRRRTTATLATGLVALATFGAALPSGAEDVLVEFTVSTNTTGLSVSSAAATAAIDDGGSNLVFDVANDATITDTLPAVTVTDQRGTLLAGWAVQVSGVNFANASGNTVANTGARVFNNYLDATALTTALGAALSGMTVVGGEYSGGTSNLGTAYTLLSGTTPEGNGSVVFTPTISVKVPAGTPVGTYTSTVTYTAS